MRILSLIFLFISLGVMGAEIKVPALNSPVVDEAGFLTAAEEEDLGQIAHRIYANQGPQITILTVNDLQDNVIEEFAIRVAEEWKLGEKDKGNGLLILIAKAERQMRIEVGQGIEGEITDIESNQFIRKILTPAFRQGMFHAGLKTVLIEIAQKFNIQVGQGEAPVVRRAQPSPGIPAPIASAFPFLIGILVLGQLFLRRKPFARGIFTGVGMAGVGAFMGAAGLAVIVVMFIFGLFIGMIGLHNLLFALAAGSGRGGFRGGGGFGGGGGWGGGGGGFSGGGSSGSW